MFLRIKKLFHRAPDFLVGRKNDPYLLRWHLTPRNPIFNIYLHKFLRDDDDRALHDHPWGSCSIILRGGYYEHLQDGSVKTRRVGRVYFRRAVAAHRIELIRIGTGIVPTWTLFLTGWKCREWGFLCPKGWRHWRDFCDERDHGAVGRGCAD